LVIGDCRFSELGALRLIFKGETLPFRKLITGTLSLAPELSAFASRYSRRLITDFS